MNWGPRKQRWLGFQPTSSHHSGMFHSEVSMRFQGPIYIALLCLVGTILGAQQVVPEPAVISQKLEDEVIAANRKGAKPRPVSLGAGLSREDHQRAKVFKDSKNSVVYINASSQHLWGDRRTGDIFALPAGTGTGFVWDEMGHVVTNHHVILMEAPSTGEPVTYAENIEVTLANGKAYKARIIGLCPEYDIAVLHVFAPLASLPPLPIGASKRLSVGQSVLAIGNPFGLDHTLTSGIVSALDRMMLTVFQTPILGAIQTDAAINPGNSGGPLLDMAGLLIGMNTAIQTTSGSSAGIGFAIPVEKLNRVVPILIAKGRLSRPVLGFTSVQSVLAARLFGVTKGVVVDVVEPNGPASRSGLLGLTYRDSQLPPILGDVIVGFQGKTFESDVQLFELLDDLPSKAPLVFDVLREGKRIQVTINPWVSPEEEPIRKTIA